MLTLFLQAMAVIILAASVSPSLAKAPGPSFVITTTQLPRGVRPVHYDLTIKPDAANLTFAGTADITIEVLKSTGRITLNAVDLHFVNAALMDVSGSRWISSAVVEIDRSNSTASITLANPVRRGRYRLILGYTGTIATQATGLFAIDYEGAAGRERALYTQLESSDARRVFPSWDEPAFRTGFSLSLNIPKDRMAVSNMPAERVVELAEGRKLVRFATTPPMSTYLLFLAVGDFERKAVRAAGTEIGVVTKRGALGQAEFALASSVRLVEEYNDYFGPPYPLPKLDNIAAPGGSQFFGAMENWGAIFSFERVLLLDPSISTARDKQRIFRITAHEIAHQWFGDLVTMHWWDDIWLNEGFASWMEARTSQKLHPEWNTELGRIEARENAMARDALVTSHPVVTRIANVDQASQTFDSITYSKGQAVIAMLEAYVGDEAWRNGVRRYIRKHAYGNTFSDDLWQEIERTAGKPVTRIAHEFTLQPGVPLIRVAEPSCEGGRTRIRLAQGQFSADLPDRKPLRWSVPVVIDAADGTRRTHAPIRLLVSGGAADVAVPGCAPLIVNAGQAGYFRTLYSAKHFQQLVGAFRSLPAIDQLGLMSDTWALGRSGLQPMPDYLDLVQATPLNAAPQIWGNIAAVFAELNDLYRIDQGRQARFRAFAIRTLGPVFADVGWVARQGEADAVAILRADLIATLSALGDPAVIGEARRRHAAQAGDPAAMPAALRRTILGVVARHAGEADWDRLRAAANREKVDLVRDQLFGLLASTEDAVLAQRALEMALTTEPGRTNSAEMIARVSALHPDLAFDFALNHHAEIDARVDTTSRTRYYARLAFRSLDPSILDKLEAYAVKHLSAESRREVDTASAAAKYRIGITGKWLPAVDDWLQQQGSR